MYRGIEITFSVDRGLRIHLIYDWSEIDKSSLEPFWDELNDRPDIISRLLETGCSTIDDVQRQYLICRYGGNDDILDVSKCQTQSDYSHCGKRGNCINQGYPGLCSLPVIDKEVITPAELESIQLYALDKSVKQIADIRHRSPHTSTTQMRTIRRKLHVNSTTAAIAKAVQKGLVKVETL